MKKFLKFSLISVLIVTSAFAVFKISSKYRVSILKDDIDCTIITKGCDRGKSIAVDEDGSTYIAYSDSIKLISSDGKETTLYRDKNLNIEELIYLDKGLFIVSNNSLLKFSLEDEEIETIIENIPLGGNDIDRKLLVKDDELYLSIGARTNAGISDGQEKDLYPIDVTLNGVNYGNNRTGAFKASGYPSSENEKIKGETIGNAAVYKVNYRDKSLKLFASGIRGITGFDYDSDGNILAIFSGMKNEGLRPVNRDSDYIYKLNENYWYGWPDYSGGDPISSPKFKGEESVKSLIKNPPNKIVATPFYQSNSLDSLREMAIDREGDVFPSDSIILWDRETQTICSLNKDGVFYKVLKLREDSNIEDIIYNGEEFLVLDSGIGCIYSIHEKGGLLGFNLPPIVWAFIFLLTFVLLVIVVLKFTNSKNK